MTRIPIESVSSIGSGLHRPECVLCTSDGITHVSDWGGGVCRIHADGRQERIIAKNAPVTLQPNGIALLRDGSYLLANLGDAGGVWRLYANGAIEPFLLDVGGQELPPCNFVLPDAAERVWISVSTTITPRAQAYRPDSRDGFIVVVDAQGARVVAEGLGYTNEVQVSPDGEWLYVNETFARRLSRFRIDRGQLTGKETVATFGPGTFPDGLCFDEEGGIWVVSIVSNRVIRIDSKAEQTIVIEDADSEHVAWVESAFQRGEMDRPHLDNVRSQRLRNISSIAFGGTDRRTAYLGCLLGDTVSSFASPVAGAEPVHWHVR